MNMKAKTKVVKNAGHGTDSRVSLEEALTEFQAAENDLVNQNIEEAWFHIGFYSIKKEWDFWARKPKLLAEEAIPLMCGIDPTTWRNRENRQAAHEHPLPDEWVAAVERELKIAEHKGIKVQSPARWLAYGKVAGLDKAILKSSQSISEPDLSMWPVFADAVAQIQDAGSHQAEDELSPVGVQSNGASGHQGAGSAPKLWLSKDKRDPAPDQLWYTPARYFARQLIIDDPTLLTKRNLLASKVAHSLKTAGIFKRGGTKALSATTVVKAFSNVHLG